MPKIKSSHPGIPTHTIAVLALFLCGLNSMAATQQDEPRVEVLASSPDSTLLRIELPQFTFELVKIDEIDYMRPVMAGASSNSMHPGAPDLPEVVRSLCIPGNAHMHLTIVDMTTTSIPNVLLAPARGDISRSMDPETVPYEFGSEFQKDELWPHAPATLGHPWIIRTKRGVDLRIKPFQYNPVQRKLLVIEDITVEVSPDGPAEHNALTEEAIRSSRMGFREMYKELFVNWEEAVGPPILPRGIEMLVIAPEAWLDEVQPLVDHRNDEGIWTVSRSIESIGNTPAQIKAHIAAEYNSSENWFGDLTYVLLVGDIEQIASSTLNYSGDTGGLDPSYGYLTGDDTRPEVFIGRFPAKSAAQATLMVSRTLAFEHQVDAFSSHRDRALGIASNDGNGANADNGERDWVHLNIIRTNLLASGYTDVAQVYDPGATTAAANAAIENGVGFINYTGHGSQQTWITSTFNSADVSALNNKNMWPWIVSVACDVGRFNVGECFAESWLRATTDDGDAAGAVAVFMSTIDQSWAPPMKGQDVIAAHEATGTLPRLGARCASGANAMVATYPAFGPRNAKTWHIFGDPALRLTTRKLSFEPLDWPVWQISLGADPIPPVWIDLEILDEIPRDIEFLWDNEWIDVSPAFLTLQPGERAQIKVVIDSNQLGSMDPGDYLSSILLHDRTTGDTSRACLARATVSETAPCNSDLDGNGHVEIGDLLVLIAQWGPCTAGCQADIDGNGSVDLNDLLGMLGAFGPC